MGRGRAKAKQTREARKLKYASPNTDFDSLQKELSKGSSTTDEETSGNRHDDHEAWQ